MGCIGQWQLQLPQESASKSGWVTLQVQVHLHPDSHHWSVPFQRHCQASSLSRKYQYAETCSPLRACHVTVCVIPGSSGSKSCCRSSLFRQALPVQTWERLMIHALDSSRLCQGQSCCVNQCLFSTSTASHQAIVKAVPPRILWTLADDAGELRRILVLSGSPWQHHASAASHQHRSQSWNWSKQSCQDWQFKDSHQQHQNAQGHLPTQLLAAQGVTVHQHQVQRVPDPRARDPATAPQRQVHPGASSRMRVVMLTHP